MDTNPRRHPLDRPAPDDLGHRASAYLRIAREDGVTAASRALHQKPRSEKGQPPEQALRIARGRTA